MGHIKDIANQSKIQTFPGATFEIQGDVPASQCSEARLDGDNATTVNAMFRELADPAKFAGWNLAGKVCHITTNIGGNTGDFDIILNDDTFLNLIQDPGNGVAVAYHITDGAQLILTRNASSFIRYIQAHTRLFHSITGQIVTGLNTITDPGKFPTDLSNVKVFCTGYPPPDYGEFTIISNTLDVLTTDHTFAATANDLSYTIHVPQPYATTIKGGKLYSNIPADRLQNACSILFDPLT